MEREITTARLLTYTDDIADTMGTGQPVWHDMNALVCREIGSGKPWRVIYQSNRVMHLMEDAIELARTSEMFEYGVVMAPSEEG